MNENESRLVKKLTELRSRERLPATGLEDTEWLSILLKNLAAYQLRGMSDEERSKFLCGVRKEFDIVFRRLPEAALEPCSDEFIDLAESVGYKESFRQRHEWALCALRNFVEFFKLGGKL